MAAPEQSIARPVSVHTMMVSANTSNMPKKPCLTGSVSLLEAWAMGAEPSPASFENTPRSTPQPMHARSPMPPQTASGLKALTRISRSTPGSLPALAAMTARQARI